MISSAVVIPEEAPPARSPSSLKRRQSSVSEDTNKRPRFEQRSSRDDDPTVDQAVAVEPASSPPRRKPSTVGTGAVEERKRGQRLFGALLGTLSQTSSKSVHRKRDEIEQKQRERLRRDNEEREEERRRKRADLDKIRRVEQKAWNEEGARLRHRNTRAMANFLQTKTEPRLYYRPWELRPEEEEQIKRQIADAESVIDQENREQSGAKPDGINGTNGVGTGSSENATQSEVSVVRTVGSIDNPMSEAENSSPVADAGNQQAEHAEEQETADEASKPRHEHNKDDDHGGGELVEGQEDDIMY